MISPAIRLACAGVLSALSLSGCSGSATAESTASGNPGVSATRVTRGTFTRTVRAVGTIEAIRAYSITVPRIRGQGGGTPMVLTRLARGGSRVSAGEIVAEIDKQEQERLARDRRASLGDLDEQIRRMKADQAVTRARDDTEMTEATSNVERARLAVTTNRLLPKLEAEKNTLAHEQAVARLDQLRKTYELKRKAAAADLRTLEIRRDRAAEELEYAEQNAALMVMTAPFSGLVVPKTTFRGNAGGQSEIQEGDELRPGMPILDVVDAEGRRVRTQINQSDIASVTTGQRARISLDAYPGLTFDGRVEQLSPLAVASSLTPAVRVFNALVSIDGQHEKLMPDLTAAVDIEVERLEGVLLAPRGLVRIDADGARVRIQGESGLRPVVLQTVGANQAVIASGIAEGAVLIPLEGTGGR